MPIHGMKAADLTPLDSRGRILPARDTVLAGVQLDGNFIVLSPNVRSFSYRIDLDPTNSKRFGIPMPRIGAETDLMDGAYFFVLPLVGRDYASQWRTPLKIRLYFHNSGRQLVGTDPVVSFDNNYELMFVRAVYDPLSSNTFSMRNHDVTTYSTSPDSVNTTAFNGLLEKCILLVEDSILPFPLHHYYVGENPVFWGIEGSQGYWVRAAAQIYPAVQVHELVHTFVGIYGGEYEDPWYKEGMTDYIGNLLPFQTGLISIANFVDDMLWVRDSVPAVGSFSLSDPYVRTHLFMPLDSGYIDQNNPVNFVQLVYGKGAQVSMILDRFILERSNRKYSVFSLVRDLKQRFSPAFHRRDLVQLVGEYTHEDASEFLTSLLDRASPISKDSLDHTFAALQALGRFSPAFPPGTLLSPKVSSAANGDAKTKVEKGSIQNEYRHQEEKF